MLSMWQSLQFKFIRKLPYTIPIFVLHAADYAIDYSTKLRERDLHTPFTVGLHEVNVMKSSGDIDND